MSDFGAASATIKSTIYKKSKLAGNFSDELGLWSIADSNRSPRHCQCRALAR